MRAPRWALSALLLASALPAGASSTAGAPRQGGHWAELNGHRMYYELRGHGPVLLMLHGGGSSGRRSFEQQLDAFAQHYEIIAPDQVGQGRTPDVPGPWHYTAMLADTVALLHSLRVQRLDVMGFSDGGILALMLAARHPRLVRRLVISGVNVAPEGLNPENLQELRAAPPAVSPLSVDDKLRELWLHSPTPAELNMRELESILQPVLVMSGDHDVIQLDHTLQIYKALPNAELYILPGTSHDTFGGRPEWVNPIAAAFLARKE